MTTKYSHFTCWQGLVLILGLDSRHSTRTKSKQTSETTVVNYEHLPPPLAQKIELKSAKEEKRNNSF